jgi:hypothetical protein
MQIHLLLHSISIYNLFIYQAYFAEVGTRNFFSIPQSQFRNLMETLPQSQFRNFLRNVAPQPQFRNRNSATAIPQPQFRNRNFF